MKEKEIKVLMVEPGNAPTVTTIKNNLRHGNSTALIKAGVNPRVVQQILGHSDVNITINTYTYVLPEMDKTAAKLDSIVLHRAQ